MTFTAVDLSNLQGHPDTWPSQPWYPVYQAADAVIVQALEPPPGFPGHDFIDPETGKRGYTGAALRQAKADGKKLGTYVWLWFGLADVRGNILARLATVPDSVQLDMRPWVDVEDTTVQVGIAQSQVYHLESKPDRLARQLQCESRPM
jgi:hypothetical protein